jgi:hypothetical protein
MVKRASTIRRAMAARQEWRAHMRQIAYFSTAAEPQTAELVHAILVTSRVFNRRHGISGLLVAGGNRYMQIIEGEDEVLQRLYSAIRRDGRHLAVTTLMNRSVTERCFAEWSMAYRREPALGHFDSFPQTLRYLTQQVSDNALRRQIELFARTFIAVPGDRASTPWDKVA